MVARADTGQIISLVEYPDMIDHPLASKIYPEDVLKRAKELHEEIGSTGAYTHSKGVLQIRKRVAKFIEGELAAAEMRVCRSRARLGSWQSSLARSSYRAGLPTSCIRSGSMRSTYRLP
jgi:hypothetical protein